MANNDKTHVLITSEGDVWNTEIYINGKKLNRVIKIEIDATSGKHNVPIVKIEMAPQKLVLDGDFKELKVVSLPNDKILLCTRCKEQLNRKNNE